MLWRLPQILRGLLLPLKTRTFITSFPIVAFLSFSFYSLLLSRPEYRIPRTISCPTKRSGKFIKRSARVRGSDYLVHWPPRGPTMRLPYVPNPPIPANAQEAAIIERTVERRGDEGLIPLDLALLHSPSITDGWNSFLGAIRTKTSISADLRELAICRVAALNQAHFEWTQHSPLALAAGISREGLKTIRDGIPGDLNEKQIAVLEFATASTKDGRVTDLIFEGLKKHFNEKEIVEIVATVAAYNCVSRFLIALDVAEGNIVDIADYQIPCYV